MVVLTQILFYAKKSTRNFLRRGMIDSLRIHVKGGTGGAGLPRYGGIGGSGGNVYICCKEELMLWQVKDRLKSKRLSASPGVESSSRGIIGKAGEDLVINVPVGITVYDENGVKLGEVNKEGEKLLIAKGGMGGNESSGYCGLKGEARAVVLDLKLIADIGLVGFPNAGKSTFLHAVSNARPKIASYPFTTIKPQIGMLNYQDHREISVADLPGLIEGAHANIGMGHKFLKHVERTKLLLFIADIKGFQLSPQHVHRSCLETVVLLNKEIELYKPELLNMPSMLIVNKMDTENATDIYKEIEPRLQNLAEFASECDESIQPEKVIQFDKILPASLISKNREEITMIAQRIRDCIDKHEEAKKFADCEVPLKEQLHEKLVRQMRQDAPTLV